MTDVSPLEQEPKPAPSFKEILLQSAFSPGRAIVDSVREIDLGIFGNECQELRLQTLRDPRRREFGKLVYITRDGKLLLQNRPTTGEGKIVSGEIRINLINDNTTLPWFLIQDKMVGTIIHSHPVEIPACPQDLFYLLLGDFDIFASVAESVATPKSNIVIFRGEGAPQFTREQANEKILLWEKQMTERIRRFTSPDISIPEQLEINNRAGWALLRQIVQKYDLKIFSGDGNSTKVLLLTQV